MNEQPVSLQPGFGLHDLIRWLLDWARSYLLWLFQVRYSRPVRHPVRCMTGAELVPNRLTSIDTNHHPLAAVLNRPGVEYH